MANHLPFDSADPDACTCLVKRFAPLVYNHALRLVEDNDEAEGVLQKTFVKACTWIGDFEGRIRLSTWLYHVVTNEALVQHRRRRRPMESVETLGERIQPNDLPGSLTEWPLDPADVALDGELRGH